MTGVRQVETDYQHVVEVLRGATRPLTTREVAQRCGRSHDYALTRLHAAVVDGLADRLEDTAQNGTPYVWRLRK